MRECFCSRKRHVETTEERRKWGESKGARGGGAGGGGKREEKITFAEYKYGLSNRTLQSSNHLARKKKNVLEQTAFWHEIKVVYFLALRANLVVMPV